MKLSKKLLTEIVFTSSRSSGPGGQNVNKVNSAALLKWNFLESQNINESQKELIQKKLANCINKSMELYIRCDESRDLNQNKKRCLERLSELLKLAFHIPKTRKPTKPTKASKLKRLEGKRIKSEIKSNRKKVF